MSTDREHQLLRLAVSGYRPRVHVIIHLDGKIVQSLINYSISMIVPPQSVRDWAAQTVRVALFMTNGRNESTEAYAR